MLVNIHLNLAAKACRVLDGMRVYLAHAYVHGAGSQRCEVLGQERAECRELKRRVRVIADHETPRIPRVVSERDVAYWGGWAWRVSDAWVLSDHACKLFAEIAPEVCQTRASSVQHISCKDICSAIPAL